MPVRCSKCGEELLGSVNRCWKCGTLFHLRTEKSGLPPVRMTPVETVIAAELADTEAPVLAEVLNQDLGIESPPPGENENTSVRRGSPFADSFTPTKLAASGDRTSREHVELKGQLDARKHMLLLLASVSSLLLGSFSVVLLFVSAVATFFISTIGLGLGLTGLRGNRRGPAIAGIVLCCLALGLAGFVATLYVFELMFDYNPLDFTQTDID